MPKPQASVKPPGAPPNPYTADQASMIPPMPTQPTIAPAMSFGDWEANPGQQSQWSQQWADQRTAVTNYNQAWLERVQQQQAQQSQQQAAAAYQAAPSAGTPLNPQAKPVSSTGVITAGPAAQKSGVSPGIVNTAKYGAVVQPGAARIPGYRYAPYIEEQLRAQEKKRALWQSMARNKAQTPTPTTGSSWGY
jgi:hypothetical protein